MLSSLTHRAIRAISSVPGRIILPTPIIKGNRDASKDKECEYAGLRCSQILERLDNSSDETYIEMINELKARVDEQDTKIDEQDTKIDKQDTKIETLTTNVSSLNNDMSIIHIRGLFDDFHDMLIDEVGSFLTVAKLEPEKLVGYWSKRTIYDFIKILKEHESNDRLREHLQGKGIDLDEVLSICDCILEWRPEGNKLAHPGGRKEKKQTVASYLVTIGKLHDQNLQTKCIRILDHLKSTKRLN